MLAMKWTPQLDQQLSDLYPKLGKQQTMEVMGLSEAQIRQRASRLGLKQNKDSEFFKAWQAKAAASKVGKKRPEQAFVMSSLHKSGKLKKTPEQMIDAVNKMNQFNKLNGHPKGMLGKKHSNENKKQWSEKHKEWWANMSESEKDEQCFKSTKARASKIGNLVSNRKRGSWKAGWRVVGEQRCYFRSAWEANYARVLQLMMERGKIICWEHEPETFWFEGIKRGCVSYLPDFRVTTQDADTEYHEVKGWMDAASQTKLKRMAKYHPKVTMVLIDSKKYKLIQGEYRWQIEDWEV